MEIQLPKDPNSKNDPSFLRSAEDILNDVAKGVVFIARVIQVSDSKATIQIRAKANGISKKGQMEIIKSSIQMNFWDKLLFLFS